MKKLIQIKKALFFLVLSAIALGANACNNEDEEVLSERIIGADISWLPEQEAKGMKFYDKGKEGDAIKILSEYNFNWIRLRLFVDPTTTNGYSKDGYCDLAHTIQMARRIKAAGMKFLLNFHYSDTWADPGKQFIPESWSNLSQTQLESKLKSYTKEVIEELINKGLTPDMVQIGNEINHGFLWPAGKIDKSYTAFSKLLSNASLGVREANKNIPIMVHIACGGQNQESVKFYDEITKAGVDFDIIGQSYYPEWHGTLEELKYNLNYLAKRYKLPVIVVEYKEYRKEVNEIVKQIPDGLGKGTFIWEATSHQWGGLFDENGNTTDFIEIYKSI